MNDDEILGRINELVAEEHELDRLAEHAGLDDAQQTRMRDLKVRLDQCWDLLRQRRARREFGMNPDESRLRDASVVEHYKG